MPDSFKDTLHNLLNRFQKQKSRWERISTAWEQIATDFKNYAHPTLLRKGVLVVDVEDSNWLYFLNLKKKELIEELNKKLSPEERIREIRLRVR
jgi:predicted nucleic acid-binding Zn ribbon protein